MGVNAEVARVIDYVTKIENHFRGGPKGVVDTRPAAVDQAAAGRLIAGALRDKKR